ncbi:MAG: tyrosine-type recombinase/integrase [Chloroflexi bacterium]|nr:tyrosine-type recombinase/integrase [Chloroflexota bacterium]
MKGHYRKRGANTWAIVVELPADPVTGKRRQKWTSIKGTEKDAQVALRRQLHDLDTGKLSHAEKLTVKRYLEQWLDSKARSSISPRTHARYREICEKHISPAIGKIRLDKLRPLDVQRLVDSLPDKGLSRRTVLHVFRVFHNALERAVRLQLLSVNPASAVEPSKPDQADIAVVDSAGAAKLMDEVVGTRLEVPVALALGAGLRRSEILGLRWGDVDFDDGRATIRQTCQLVKVEEPSAATAKKKTPRFELRFLTTKTHRSRRSVTLPPSVVGLLRRSKASQSERRLLLGAGWQDNDLVVERGDGKPVRPDTLTKQFHKVSDRLGLGVTFHGLRHSHASLLLKGGVSMKAISERLGHVSASFTADVYTHLGRGIEEQAAEAFDRVVKHER